MLLGNAAKVTQGSRQCIPTCSSWLLPRPGSPTSSTLMSPRIATCMCSQHGIEWQSVTTYIARFAKLCCSQYPNMVELGRQTCIQGLCRSRGQHCLPNKACQQHARSMFPHCCRNAQAVVTGAAAVVHVARPAHRRPLTLLLLLLCLRTPPNMLNSSPALTSSWPYMVGHSAATSCRS